jgi:hypothetical protein
MYTAHRDRFAEVGERNEDCCNPVTATGETHGQDSTHGLDLAIESQLSDHDERLRAPAELPGCRQDPERDR